MKFYKTTLEAMEKLLTEANEPKYAAIVSECIKKWDSDKNTLCFVKEFAKGGKFAEFSFNKSDFKDDEHFYWGNELFSALVAMSVQLANFIRLGKTVDIAFLHAHFGRPKEIIKGSACLNCNSRQINAADVDEYIAPQIIAAKIIDGLANDTLNQTVDEIMNLSSSEISARRQETKIRILNSSIPFSQERTQPKFCLLCGSHDIKQCQFLKSLKQNIFIPLNK